MVKLDLDELKLVEEPDNESPIEMNYRLDREVLEVCSRACKLLTEIETNFCDNGRKHALSETRIENARRSVSEFREWAEKVLEDSRSNFVC